MELLKAYSESSHSDHSDHDPSQDDHVQEPPSIRLALGSLAPEVDISDLQLAKHQADLSRFQRETEIKSQQNHLTGFLQEATLDPVKFYE